MNPYIAILIMAMLVLALAFASVRLYQGPSMADRVVALEVISSILIGLLATYAVYYKIPQALDVAMVLALTGFLAAIGVSRYLVQRGRDNEGDDVEGKS